MNVSLTPELEKLVERKVKTGRYQTASEVIREALRALEERDQVAAIRLHELRKEIQKGLRSGKATPLDMEEIKRETQEELNAGQIEMSRRLSRKLHRHGSTSSKLVSTSPKATPTPLIVSTTPSTRPSNVFFRRPARACPSRTRPRAP